MKLRLIILATLVMTLALAIPAQGQSSGGVVADCGGGNIIQNGVEVLVNMRSGFTYTATAIGIDGFDPVLAVRGPNGETLCNDDSSAAAGYSANLPTTGAVNSSNLSAQQPFSHNFSGLADISLIVGGFGSTTGEFVLVIEGLAVTSADGSGNLAGDPFSVHVTPNMMASGVPVTAYMISVTDALDPYMRLIDADYNTITLDNSPVICDDSGNASLCWGESTALSNSSVSRSGGRQLGGFQYDAMLTIPNETLGLEPDEEGYLNFLMTSFEQRYFGDYEVAFHLGIGNVSSPGSGGKPGTTPTNTPAPPPPSTGGTADYGVVVACGGGNVIENGVEVIVNMRSGFTYTATVIGIDGFDPVLAVRGPSGEALCNDDNSSAAGYSANLPTTGLVNSSSLSAQQPFSHSFSGLADISLIVGGFGNTAGEFLLVIEGLAVTSADGSGNLAGDPFSVHVTPNMMASGVPVSAYMISVTNATDPYMRLIDADYNTITLDNSQVICDDSGNASACWGNSSALNNSYVSRTQGRQLGGFQYDAMLTIPNETLGLGPNDEGYLNFLMTTYQQQTFGDYLVAFHLGTSAVIGVGSDF